jgi:hypothetical protein
MSDENMNADIFEADVQALERHLMEQAAEFVEARFEARGELREPAGGMILFTMAAGLQSTVARFIGLWLDVMVENGNLEPAEASKVFESFTANVKSLLQREKVSWAPLYPDAFRRSHASALTSRTVVAGRFTTGVSHLCPQGRPQTRSPRPQGTGSPSLTQRRLLVPARPRSRGPFDISYRVSGTAA